MSDTITRPAPAPPAHETAFGHRDKSCAPVIVGIWPDPADNEANTKWVRDHYAANHPDAAAKGATSLHVRRRRPPCRRQLEAAYDPDNLFHVNQNITPANGRWVC